ncbi:MAG: TonB-dependent receptor plug domain-containing protein, partial [Gammaproteobacteria bacterium]|nr:TonB-dependent receptor plug domain-containing protein [Gammaproteobacteria bacterium]NIY12845.1 TonB-dependent receptor plug domain-containing protein [Gemmatimonadota bacterium]
MRLARYALAAVAALVVAAAPVSAQTQYTIQGLVRDAATGDGISGVQVQLRGTDFGTITDAAGRYMLRADVASGSYEITYTFIGRSAETRSIELGGDATIQVPAVYLAESALELEELVVTGTTAPTARRAIGNAITSVSETQLEATPAVTVDQALQGKVSGALITSNTGNPGGGVSVRLRGTSSIIGGAEPLIIVDGVIMDNSSDQVLNFGYRSNPSNRLADLDPADIERIEIIKGAAAAALYGSRANNGVIQIFTKRGSAGEPQITVSTELRRSSLPDEIEFAMTPVDEDGNPVQRYDHQDLIFEPGYSNETHVSVSGGTEGT